MASFTVTPAFLSAAGPASIRSSPAQRRQFATTNALAKSNEIAESSGESKNMRRDVMFAAAAAAMCSVAGIALADGEPRRGSAEAKRAYAPVCVTNPTARICRN